MSLPEPYYSDEWATIYHARCEDVLPHLASVQFALTSPPYNTGKSYERTSTLSDYLEWQASVIAEVVGAVESSGSICWQVGNYVDSGEVFPLDVYLYPAFKDLGLKLRNRIAWTFGHGLHASSRFSGRYETLMWFTKSDEYTFNLDAVRVPSKYPGKRHYKGPNKGKLSGNPLGKNPSDVWDIPNVKHNHPEKTEHPCQFPEALVERCILALTNEGDVVLDPFLGSGTTLAVAPRLNRYAIGIEIEERYCEIAAKRLAQEVLPLEVKA